MRSNVLIGCIVTAVLAPAAIFAETPSLPTRRTLLLSFTPAVPCATGLARWRRCR